MGEEVSKLWSRDEQLKFDALEQLVPVMDQKTYWTAVSKNFASKPRIDVIKYYLNVFLIRRVLIQCKLSLLEIDSDEDEVEEEDQPEGFISLQRYRFPLYFMAPYGCVMQYLIIINCTPFKLPYILVHNTC
jgi:hypothetical protein